MKCGRCEHENRAGAKFCEECAVPLARVCANCGAALSVTAKFCSECAHPIWQDAPSQRFYGRIGAQDSACEHLAIAATMYRAMKMPFWLEQVETEMRALA